ncbi:hypothetical protein ES707_07840 [subsurface metagenome]
MDEAANAELSEYIADRIRRRVKDPEVAEKLIPKDHGFGVQRLPLETNYFEAYNRDNVHLVDISETPLVRVTEKGLRTTARDYEFDIIVYATGFDAITGAYDLIDIRGIGGERLSDKWKHAPSTFLGMLVHGFPNMLMPTGPQSASASTNFPRGIENGVNWCMGLLQYIWDHGYTRADATAEAQERWTAHVVKMYEIMLMRKAKSWFTGYNSNVAGHEEGTVRYFVYNGGTPKFVGIINQRGRSEAVSGDRVLLERAGRAGRTTLPPFGVDNLSACSSAYPAARRSGRASTRRDRHRVLHGPQPARRDRGRDRGDSRSAGLPRSAPRRSGIAGLPVRDRRLRPARSTPALRFQSPACSAATGRRAAPKPDRA